MLARSGFSIRKLITPWQSREEDGELSELHETSSLKSVKQQPRGRSWIGKRQSVKKVPKPIVVIRRSQSIHRISSSLPPLPDTPYSSVSSLCSCDCHAHGASGHVSEKSTSGLCPNRSKTSYEKTPSSSPSLRHDGRTSSPKASQKRINDMQRMPPKAIESTFDLLEALSLQPEDDVVVQEKRVTPKMHHVSRNHRAEHSDNVQQLIQETDQAFNAVVTGLAKTNIGPLDFPMFERPRTPPAPRRSPQPPPTPIFTKKPSKAVPQIPKSPKSPRSPRRQGSISKAKKKPTRQRRKATATATAKYISRWTLKENVSELLNVRLFSRIEADEMLTPRQLQDMRKSRIAQLRLKKSTETIRTAVTAETDDSETPVEPFHLEGLPSRIGSSGVRLSVPSPLVEVATSRPFDIDEPTARQGFAVQDQSKVKSLKDDASLSTETCTAVSFQDIAFPVPPKNPLRFAPGRRLPPLPTIPEVKVLSPGEMIPPQPHLSSSDRVVSEDFLFFRSTPFTLTMPTYRHGPVRLAKADLNVGLKTLSPDDILDWTAFQMAILGGAGDLFTEATDYTRHRGYDGDDEAVDLADWFDAFGFEHGGLLESRPPPPSPVTADYSPVSSASSTQDNLLAQNLPIPVGSEYPSGFWNINEAANINCAELGASRFLAPGCGIKRWTAEGHPKPYVGMGDSNRGSLDSLPQSPMLNIGKTGDGVPMGYNLGHDLGDFLRWEAEHVYADGFYGLDE